MYCSVVKVFRFFNIVSIRRHAFISFALFSCFFFAFALLSCRWSSYHSDHRFSTFFYCWWRSSYPITIDAHHHGAIQIHEDAYTHTPHTWNGNILSHIRTHFFYLLLLYIYIYHTHTHGLPSSHICGSVRSFLKMYVSLWTCISI